MARTVKPEIVARIVPEQTAQPPGVPAPPAETSRPEQLEALQGIVDWLNEETLNDQDAIDALLGDEESVRVEIRRVPAGEVWVRVDK